MSDAPSPDDEAPRDAPIGPDGEIQDEEATGEEQVANSPRERKLELGITVMLALSALLSAWCAYQSTRFSGDQTTLNTKATGLELQATRADNRAGQLALVDVNAFDLWLSATLSGDGTRAEAYRQRFRPEARPAFDAWIALDPLTAPGAPRTPFEMPEYRVEYEAKARQLQSQAQAANAQGDEQGATGDKYVLTVVLFAAALFLLGIQSRIGVFELRAGLVGVAALIVVGTTLWVIALPKQWPF